jgi:Flp pilus assembly protein TadD
MRLLLCLLLSATIIGARAALAPDQAENVRALLRDKQLAAAESAAKALVAANPKEAEAHALLGAVGVAKGDADAAVKAHEKAAALAPAHSDYQRQLGDAYGLAAQKAGLLSKMSLGKKCLELRPTPGAPGHDAAHWRLGNLWERKGDKSAARAAYRAALAINSSFPQAIDALKKLD